MPALCRHQSPLLSSRPLFLSWISRLKFFRRSANFHAQPRPDVIMAHDDFDYESCPGPWVWVVDPGLTLKAFPYLRDPLFVAACLLYAVNRWAVKPHVHDGFLHGQFDDLLLIPCALPPLLLAQRWLKLREHDRPPAFSEIALHLTIWSILFEVLGPHILAGTVGDPWDVVAYVAGGIFAGFWWNRTRLIQPAARHGL